MNPADLRAAAPEPVGKDVGLLGALVDQAAWSQDGVADTDADAAWGAADRVRAGLVAGRTRPARLRRSLDPRVLTHR